MLLAHRATQEREATTAAIISLIRTNEIDRVAYALSTADDIREVENAGQRDERLLPAGQDSGYLWRASNFTRFTEREDGVYVEMETIGLSRGFPPFLGWLIEPIARRLGRKSIERSLEEFIAEVRKNDEHPAARDDQF